MPQTECRAIGREVMHPTIIPHPSTRTPRFTRVNYLHREDALDLLASRLPLDSSLRTKSGLLEALGQECRGSPGLVDVVLGYGNPYVEVVDIPCLESDILQSVALREYFRSVACRGFSFEVGLRVEFSWELRPSMDFSLALYTSKDLYYPSRVRRYLPRARWSHVSRGRMPAIAFALGRYIQDNLFVFVLQSDLVFQGPSCVREHFRGWRKILFGQVQAHVRPGTRRIYLCRSEDIRQTCHPAYNPPKKVPLLWRQIYESTASFFGMRPIRLQHRLNIQCLRQIPRHFSCDFFVAELNPAGARRGGKRYERL
jgi:hypothetical protein